MITTKKLSLVLLIAAITVILWYAISLPKDQGNNKPAEVINNATSTEPTITATSTKDWLTYRNEEYGLEVKYPKEYKLEKKSAVGEAFNSQLISSKTDKLNIYFYVVNLNQFIINALKSDLNSKFCKGSYDNHSCYIYREEEDIFYKYDKLTKNNKKYEFSIKLSKIDNLNQQQNINLFFQNKFNPQDQYLINILDQIKASMVFY